MLTKGDTAKVITTTTDIHEHTNDLITVKRRDSQLLYGERFTIELVDGDWAFGKSDNDGYEGFVAVSDLEKNSNKPTHIVTSRCTHMYDEPTFKMRPSCALSFKSELVCNNENKGGFIKVKNGGWVPENHVTLISKHKEYAATTAEQIAKLSEKFIDTPYIYGGRSAHGIDCSGLVQVTLQSIGIKCPRDSDQQLNAIGTQETPDIYKRGDIVFFPGHVGIMMNENSILNATATSMDTSIEPFQNMITRYKSVSGFKRFE